LALTENPQLFSFAYFPFYVRGRDQSSKYGSILARAPPILLRCTNVTLHCSISATSYDQPVFGPCSSNAGAYLLRCSSSALIGLKACIHRYQPDSECSLHEL
jgi:hypothetical protein